MNRIELHAIGKFSVALLIILFVFKQSPFVSFFISNEYISFAIIVLLGIIFIISAMCYKIINSLALLSIIASLVFYFIWMDIHLLYLAASVILATSIDRETLYKIVSNSILISSLFVFLLSIYTGDYVSSDPYHSTLFTSESNFRYSFGFRNSNTLSYFLLMSFFLVALSERGRLICPIIFVLLILLYYYTLSASAILTMLLYFFLKHSTFNIPCKTKISRLFFIGCILGMFLMIFVPDELDYGLPSSLYHRLWYARDSLLNLKLFPNDPSVLIDSGLLNIFIVYGLIVGSIVLYFAYIMVPYISFEVAIPIVLFSLFNNSGSSIDIIQVIFISSFLNRGSTQISRLDLNCHQKLQKKVHYS